ncbi:hypothetical protein CK203_095300 [Vitis vinifera]|uniref:Uncharacterized protein n=1 Tax=Vitis vinifera TaxID=29760 RepID=A0A438D8D5_VITVI|nr:hypothetical protein CK203_095300 [Vitis vinifera]
MLVLASEIFILLIRLSSTNGAGDLLLRGSPFGNRRGKIQGCIVEKKGGALSWVRLGAESLTFFLEGLNLCIKGEKEIRWGREWKEQDEHYSMIRGTNRAGGFIRLGVSDVEGKKVLHLRPERS